MSTWAARMRAKCSTRNQDWTREWRIQMIKRLKNGYIKTMRQMNRIQTGLRMHLKISEIAVPGGSLVSLYWLSTASLPAIKPGKELMAQWPGPAHKTFR